MAWLEITVNTKPGGVEALATALTGLGFEDFCIEDQQEFESFLEENREYWDYIDEDLCNVWVDELRFGCDDIPDTLEGWLDHKKELKKYQYEIDLIDMICNHYNEINLENCTYEINV